MLDTEICNRKTGETQGKTTIENKRLCCPKETKRGICTELAGYTKVPNQVGN